MDRSKTTALPGAPEPEARLSATPWAALYPQAAIARSSKRLGRDEIANWNNMLEPVPD